MKTAHPYVQKFELKTVLVPPVGRLGAHKELGRDTAGTTDPN